MSGELVVRLVDAAAWASRPAGPTWVPDDYDAEGFVHLSTPSQLQRTLDKHYAGLDDLLALWLDPERFAGDLRWEGDEGGPQFPHLYAPMEIDAVVATTPVLDGVAPAPPADDAR